MQTCLVGFKVRVTLNFSTMHTNQSLLGLYNTYSSVDYSVDSAHPPAAAPAATAASIARYTASLAIDHKLQGVLRIYMKYT